MLFIEQFSFECRENKTKAIPEESQRQSRAQDRQKSSAKQTLEQINKNFGWFNKLVTIEIKVSRGQLAN